MVRFLPHCRAEAELARRYDVQSIPTFAVFCDGELTDRRVGVMRERELIELVRGNSSDRML